MEAGFSFIYQSLEWFAQEGGREVAPWLLLLTFLIAALLASREIVLTRRARDTRHDRHLVNLVRFRGELAKRQALENRPQIEYWP